MKTPPTLAALRLQLLLPSQVTDPNFFEEKYWQNI